MVKLALTLQNCHLFYGGDLMSLLSVSQAAEAKGIDHLLIGDHLIMAVSQADHYPGKLPVSVDYDQLEPLTLFAAIAAVTSRVRLITGILLGPLRPAIFLAKQAATLDVLSNGRLDLGIGVGWQQAEYAAEGLPFEGRFGRMVDQIGACRALWTQAPASFASKTVSFDTVYSKPFPVQPGGPPIWIGATLSDRNLARVADLAQGWMITSSSEQKAALADNVARLRAAFQARGRDPATLQVSYPVATRYETFGEMLAEARELAAAGATMLTYRPGVTCRSRAEFETLLDRMVAVKDALGDDA